ncbi:ankyrin repeat domain-containing protein [Desulfospira joergensenii]|uniref:ankyrin repeat domain-containing protein n=1 Tax=Desulfospira joergensenii TaxID=53329 RepID=UPI0003B4A870|nr:ankyrin repeat domain-containing protein [Desulfospira joergensenii]
MKRRLFPVILLFVCLSWSIAPAQDFNDLSQVLETFSDSRKTRDLKEFGSQADKAAFTQTIENKVYKPVDRAVINHISQLPEYAGKRILTHDFRTPGKDSTAVNTDRDVRVLVEVEMDRWIEVPVKHWEDVYYKEFARHTGMAVDAATPREAVRQHAETFRQLPTDRFHMEASADFSDVGTIRAFEVNGKTKVLSCPNVVRAKKGFTRLKDPEGLARMYFEKADEQFRRARDMERQLAAADPERAAVLKDRIEMFEIEGAVQLKKGVQSLDALREGYKEQGLDTGRIPKDLASAMDKIREVDGTSRTDIKKLRADIAGLKSKEINSLTDITHKVSGQIESLKLAQKAKADPRFKAKLSLAGAGQAAGIAGDLLSIKAALDSARQGNHLFINFDAKDTAGEKALKTLALAAIELSPIPVVEALDRGWQVADEEKDYTETLMAHGEYGDWRTHPVTRMARISTKVVYRTATAMTLDPLIAGKTAVEEGIKTTSDISDNLMASFSREASLDLQAEKLDRFQVRSRKVDLSAISFMVNQRPMGSGDVILSPEDDVVLTTRKTSSWTEDYRARWEIIAPDKTVTRLKEAPAESENANRAAFEVGEFPLGTYQAVLRFFEAGSGLQADFIQTAFKMSEETGLGELSISRKIENGQDLKLDPPPKNLPLGEALLFQAVRKGDWPGTVQVEWLVNGRRYKYTGANDPNANTLTLDTTDLQPGPCKVAVRLFDSAAPDKIVAHQALAFSLEAQATDLTSFTVKGFRERDNTLSPVKGLAIQNGDILRFTADVPLPRKASTLTRLVWQVYDAKGRPVPGLTRETSQPADKEQIQSVFRFRPDQFADGGYVVALTHHLVSDPDVRVQARAEFQVREAIRITKALTTDNKKTLAPKTVFHPGQRPLFYVYYDLDPAIKEVTIRLSVKKKNGQVLDSATVTRPKEGATPPYRIGFTIPDKAFAVGDGGVFTAEIATADGTARSVSREFSLAHFPARIRLPNSLASGRPGTFTIELPKDFEAPYKVSMTPGSGLSLGLQPGKLTGTITGIATNGNLKASVKATVTDAAGRMAVGRTSLVIKGAKLISVASGNQKGSGMSQKEMAKTMYKYLASYDLEKVRAFLDAGCPVDINLEWGYTPLMRVVEYAALGHSAPGNYFEKVTALLLARGANRNLTSDNGTPLQMVEHTLTYRKEPDIRQRLLRIRNLLRQ